MSRSVAVVAVLLSAMMSESRAQEPPRIEIVGPGGARIAGTHAVVKGRSVRFTARIVGASGQAHWSTDNAAVLGLTESEGSVTVECRRDWFDESPNREPAAALRVCSAELCAAVRIACVVDVEGHWPAHLDFSGIPHAEDRDLHFIQNGREVRFLVDGEWSSVRLEGNRITLVQRGVLTRFDGTLSSRTAASGRFSSRFGFSGTWTANKR